MISRMFEMFMKQKVGVLPTCEHYGELLGLAVARLGISREEARERYGRYTYAEWADLLGY